ncbi:hypothetical protein [Terrilactibacillus tamarindi]|nr:hypothetical protein [Terrilactibacillus tamarindi]
MTKVTSVFDYFIKVYSTVDVVYSLGIETSIKSLRKLVDCGAFKGLTEA